MTQYTPQYPGAPMPPPMTPPRSPFAPAGEQGRRRFPFVAGYLLWFMPALWRDAGRRWRGFGFLYILLLLALTWAAEFAKLYPQLNEFVRDEVPVIVEKLPTIDIKDGVVSTDVEEPYVVSDPETGQVIFVIDTTGATTEPPPDPPSILLRRSKLIVRDENKVQTFDLSQVQSFHLDKQRVQGWAESAREKFWPVGYPVAVGVSLAGRLLQMLIYSLIGLAVASSVRPPLTFGAVMRLSALAITPVILLDTVFFLTGIDLGCVWTLLGIALAIVLLVFMVRSNHDPMASPPPGGGFYPPQGRAPVYAPAAPAYGQAPAGYAPPQQGYGQQGR